MRVVLAFLSTAAPPLAQDVAIGVRVRERLTRYDGAITADGRDNNGTRLDASDLGLDDYGFAHELRVSVDIPEAGPFHAGYWRLRREGDEVLEADAAFDRHLSFLTLPSTRAVA